MYLKPNIEKMKKRKKELGWTNQKLAEESGVPAGTLNKIFNGTTRYPRDETIDALIRAMGLNNYEIEKTSTWLSAVRETGVYRAGRKDNRATLDTYYSLPDELRVELIDGRLYYMPAPTLRHQSILMTLSANLYSYFADKEKEYRVLAGHCDVQLDYDEYTMLKPDIFVVRGKEYLLNEVCCLGAPEFVIEIVSQSNPEHDYELKRYKYQHAGVKEYWIVDPVKMRILDYVFVKDTVPIVCNFENKIRAYLYPDFEMDFERVRKEMV